MWHPGTFGQVVDSSLTSVAPTYVGRCSRCVLPSAASVSRPVLCACLRWGVFLHGGPSPHLAMSSRGAPGDYSHGLCFSRSRLAGTSRPPSVSWCVVVLFVSALVVLGRVKIVVGVGAAARELARGLQLPLLSRVLVLLLALLLGLPSVPVPVPVRAPVPVPVLVLALVLALAPVVALVLALVLVLLLVLIWGGHQAVVVVSDEMAVVSSGDAVVAGVVRAGAATEQRSALTGCNCSCLWSCSCFCFRL